MDIENGPKRREHIFGKNFCLHNTRTVYLTKLKLGTQFSDCSSILFITSVHLTREGIDRPRQGGSSLLPAASILFRTPYSIMHGKKRSGCRSHENIVVHSIVGSLNTLDFRVFYQIGTEFFQFFYHESPRPPFFWLQGCYVDSGSMSLCMSLYHTRGIDIEVTGKEKSNKYYNC